ncbi:Glu/Leu/Phe/Val dehydrogenase dimerization domain-containing protein [Catenulispora rubra]|uniref:Glu/Leu/Phe/Val dehydrogenase dimerization domain-containing protein n=1 Tax=Catenulispora rubra TaxID=280293 RepID=UPI00189243A2|nr:Glu/Leu/Phe/Val dehydrogenase dimerization domain-containing protein [Catenulispora rubra]
MSGFPQWSDHEAVLIRTGARSGLPVVVAMHSSVLGPSAGGCRIWRYPRWQDGLEDALRLSAAMTAKFAAAGLARGGGKTVVAMPEGYELTPEWKRGILHDVADAIESLDGRYATGPDVGTSPQDMVVIGERTSYVFCKPAEYGGSGDSSPATAEGSVAALRAVAAQLGGGNGNGNGNGSGSGTVRGLRVAVVGLGSVGARIAALLSEAGAELVLSDIDASKKDLADGLGAQWHSNPHQALTADVDIVVPAALGGVLTEDIVPDLRCRAIVGPANNQLAVPDVADALHKRGIAWVPDYIASAGGVIHAITVELDKRSEDEAGQRVRGIEDTVAGLLQSADTRGVTLAAVAEESVRARLSAATGR